MSRKEGRRDGDGKMARGSKKRAPPGLNLVSKLVVHLKKSIPNYKKSFIPMKNSGILVQRQAVKK